MLHWKEKAEAHSPTAAYRIFIGFMCFTVLVSTGKENSFLRRFTTFFLPKGSSLSLANATVTAIFDVKYNESDPDAFGQMILKRSFMDHTNQTETQNNDDEETKQKPRVLIAQYDYGNLNNSYAEMIQISSKINKAYAHKYNYDYLLARGVYITEIAPNHPGYAEGRVAAGSTSNKVGVLEYALQHPRAWDYVLIMDSDAMMYDFERDIGYEYDMTNEVLVAHRVLRVLGQKTFDINAGVMLWNMKHDESYQLVKDWDMEIHEIFKTKVGEDQEALHNVLRRIPRRRRPVRAIRHDFEYSRGTFIKHFTRQGRKAVRKGWDDTKLKSNERIDHMRQTANDICKQYNKLCDGASAE